MYVQLLCEIKIPKKNVDRFLECTFPPSDSEALAPHGIVLVLTCSFTDKLGLDPCNYEPKTFPD